MMPLPNLKPPSDLSTSFANTIQYIHSRKTPLISCVNIRKYTNSKIQCSISIWTNLLNGLEGECCFYTWAKCHHFDLYCKKKQPWQQVKLLWSQSMSVWLVVQLTLLPLPHSCASELSAWAIPFKCGQYDILLLSLSMLNCITRFLFHVLFNLKIRIITQQGNTVTATRSYYIWCIAAQQNVSFMSKYTIIKVLC